MNAQDIAEILHSITQEEMPDDNAWHIVVRHFEKHVPGVVDALRLLESDTDFTVFYGDRNLTVE